MTSPSRRGWASPVPQQTVAFGYSINETVPEALSRLGARRALVITTNAAHSPRQDVARIVKALDTADSIVTIGGGSVCDAVKGLRGCAMPTEILATAR